MLPLKYFSFFVFLIKEIKFSQYFSAKAGLKFFITWIWILSVHTVNAQKDTMAVDTISMSKIDSIAGHDDEDDGYVDTTVKHIYDTSQFFFNQKEYAADVYTKEKITQRHLVDSAVEKLKSEDDFWYIPAIEKLERRLKNDPGFRDSLVNEKNHGLNEAYERNFLQQPWFKFFLWFIIIGIFIAALMYFLFQNKINLFSRQSASVKEGAGSDEGENIFSLSYSKLIQKAENEKDYRVAIRLQFLKTLSETGNIQYQPDYTNLHYLQQLQASKFYNEFFKLTHNYEYVWFGKFNVSTERYNSIKNDFLILQHKII